MKILLLGIGNVLFGDEGIGVHFTNYIARKYRFDTEHQLDIMDGGTLAQRLIPIIVEYDQIIIVDTINAPGVQPGEIYFFDYEAVPAEVNWQGSAHEVEMLQTLTMMELAGDRPSTMIMGVVPTIIELTEFSLSQPVSDAVGLMEHTLIDYLSTLGIEAHSRQEVAIQSLLADSFRTSDAYSV